ncbi:hypothetical protein ACX0G9_19930 [Flavitalea flava]
MTFEQFKSTLTSNTPPPGITGCLAALWYDGKNDWEQAHNIAQDIGTRDGSWIHAYLHRKEGDNGNARYWYSRAGRIMPAHSLENEWEGIVTELLQQGTDPNRNQ